MKPAPFEYHRPTTVAETVDLLTEFPEAELMAGNQSLGVLLANRLATPGRIIDINRVDELSFVNVDADRVAVGALTRHREIERSEPLRQALPVLPEAAEQIAGPSVRNRGTLGGSLGEADPAGNYPTVLVALDGNVHLTSRGTSRAVPAREFFNGYMSTVREEDELIERATVDRSPFPPARTGMAFCELKPAAQTWPTISATAIVGIDDLGTGDPEIENAQVALANAAETPLHVPGAADAVKGEPLSEVTLEAAAEAAIAAADPTDERHADAEFKTEIAGEYTRRALATAYERAADGGG